MARTIAGEELGEIQCHLAGSINLCIAAAYVGDAQDWAEVAFRAGFGVASALITDLYAHSHEARYGLRYSPAMFQLGVRNWILLGTVLFNLSILTTLLKLTHTAADKYTPDTPSARPTPPA